MLDVLALSRLLGKCINAEDLGGVLDALHRHVAKTAQVEFRRYSKVRHITTCLVCCMPGEDSAVNCIV